MRDEEHQWNCYSLTVSLHSQFHRISSIFSFLCSIL
jgi:hypothetical protein